MPHRTVTSGLATFPGSPDSGSDPSSLLDEPDCLADMPHVYSVFRFRHATGDVTYELTFTNLSDGPDRQACWALVDGPVNLVDVIDTDTMGVGSNGVHREVTYILARA